MLPVLDIIVVLVALAFFAFLGYHFRIGTTSTSAYFLAGKNMSAIPAALSITVSLISSSVLTIYLGEIFIYGCPLYLATLAYICGAPIVIVFAIRRFYDSPYLSVYGFLEQRFSRSVKITNSVIFICTGLINSAIVGYTAAISAEVLAGVPFWLSVIVSGLLATSYSALGGIRAVIWTDVCQAFLMYLFLLLIVFKGILSFETFGEFWKILSDNKRLELRFVDGPTERCTGQAFFSYYFALVLHVLCVSQYGVQRWRSVKSIQEAKKTIYFTVVFLCMFAILVNSCGVVLYAFYVRCKENNEPLPGSHTVSLYFIRNEFGSWPGVVGLCLAGLLSGALSTCSSFINSMAAVTTEDFVKTWCSSINQKQELILSKALTVFYGLLSTVLIFVAAMSKAAVLLQLISLSISFGPVLGTFLLAVWTKRTNVWGVNIGLVAGVALIVWMSIGSFLVGNKYQPLLSGNETCSVNTSSVIRNIETSILSKIQTEDENIQSSLLLTFYRVSVYWYSLIGFSTSACLGYIFSILSARFPCYRRTQNEEQHASSALQESTRHLLKRLPRTEISVEEDKIVQSRA